MFRLSNALRIRLGRKLLQDTEKKVAEAPKNKWISHGALYNVRTYNLHALFTENQISLWRVFAWVTFGSFLLWDVYQDYKMHAKIIQNTQFFIFYFK